MKKLFLIILFSLIASLAQAQTSRNPCYQNGTQSTQGIPSCQSVSTTSPLPVVSSAPGNAITGNATGSTGAVVGTLAAATGKTTFICGFDVSAVGGTAAIGPITVAGIIGSSMVYQLTSTAAGVNFNKTYTPCIPASAVNTAITVTTTADGTATAVDVNSWGYQQ